VFPSSLLGLCASDQATQAHVLGMVQGDGRLVLQAKVRHDYPHCWRCKHGTEWMDVVLELYCCFVCVYCNYVFY
jgi:hypothetical protein